MVAAIISANPSANLCSATAVKDIPWNLTGKRAKVSLNVMFNERFAFVSKNPSVNLLSATSVKDLLRKDAKKWCFHFEVNLLHSSAFVVRYS